MPYENEVGLSLKWSIIEEIVTLHPGAEMEFGKELLVETFGGVIIKI